MSTLGVYVALCLPRSTIAMREARRPSVCPVASTTYHSRCASPASLVSHELFWVVGVIIWTAISLRRRFVYKVAKVLSRQAAWGRDHIEVGIAMQAYWPDVQCQRFVIPKTRVESRFHSQARQDRGGRPPRGPRAVAPRHGPCPRGH